MYIYVAVVWAYVAVCGYVEVCACVLMCVQYVHMLMQAKSVAMRICCFAKKQQQSHLQGQGHGPLRGYFEPTDWGQWCIGDDDRYAMIRKLPQNESTFAFQNHSVCIAHDIKPLSLNFQHLINLQKYPVSRYIWRSVLLCHQLDAGPYSSLVERKRRRGRNRAPPSAPSSPRAAGTLGREQPPRRLIGGAVLSSCRVPAAGSNPPCTESTNCKRRVENYHIFSLL